MARNDGRNLDRKLERGRLELIVAEVELAHCDVAAQGLDQVTATLVVDATMADIHVTQRVAVDHEC